MVGKAVKFLQAQATTGTLLNTMESVKINQTTLFNPQSFKTVNTEYLDDKTTQLEEALGNNQRLLDPLANQSISDVVSMETTRLFTKPILVTSGLWNIGTTPGRIYVASINNILMAASSSQTTTLLSVHAFFRSGFKLTLRVNSSPFHSGKLALNYIPPRPSVSSTFTNLTPIQVSGYPVAYADAGNQSVVSIKIPFVTTRDYKSTALVEPDTSLGSVQIFSFNPLRSGTGAPTSVGYTLWMEPIESELAIPVRAHTVALQSEDTPLSMPDLLSNLPSLVPSVLGDLNNIHKTLTSKTPPSIGMSALSKPKESSTSKQPSYTSSTPSISNLVGKNTEHLSLVPEETNVNNSFVDMEGRKTSSVSSIAQVPMLLSTLTWLKSDPSATLKFTIPVTPTLAAYTAPTATAQGSRDYSFCSWVAQPFAFWRGSLNYRITVASTQQHTGRLIATWIPGDQLLNGVSVLLPNPSLSDLVLYPSIVFDLAENKEFNISVPYQTSTPFKKIRSQDLGSTTDVDSVNGVLYVYVLSPLSGPAVVSDTIDINIYMSAGKDIQFKGLRTERNSVMATPYITDGVQLQSEDVALESSKMGMEQDKANSMSLQKHNVAKDGDQGYSDDDLYKLLARYYPQIGYRFTVAPESNRIFRLAQHPGLQRQGATGQKNNTLEYVNLVSHFSEIFTFWEGSLNYFFLHNTTVNNPVLATFTHNHSNPAALSPSAYATNDNYALASVGGAFADNAVDLSVSTRYSHISNLRINAAVEITLPFRTFYRRCVITPDQQYRPTAVPGVLEVLYSNPSGTEQTVSLQLFQSVGDDFRFHYLVPPNQRILAAT